MFSDDSSVKVDLSKEDLSADYIEAALRSVLERHGLVAALLLALDDDGPRAVVTARIAREPLDGNLRPLLKRMVDECTARYAAPHVQALSAEVVDELRAVNPSIPLKYRVAFVPFIAGCRRFAFVGFLGEGDARAVPPALRDDLAGVIRLVALSSEIGEQTKHLLTLERYVKEVGHDIASAVQASVAKLHNIARGVVPDSAVRAKAREAEEEILGAYRVAENLGLVVDPDYNIGSGSDFDLVEVARRAVEQHRGEANERHVDLDLTLKVASLTVWGDGRAVESALGHYLNNAIKYANGGSQVSILVYRRERDQNACVSVTDRGIQVKASDLQHVWDFGFRGREALERHVNGSGIGLYSVRKIIRAHNGEVGVTWDPQDARTVTFWMSIPIGRVLEKPLLTRSKM